MVQIDMQMPESCGTCKFMDDSGDYPFCRVLLQNRGYSFDVFTKRFPNCPLKPVEEQKEDTENGKLKNMCRVLFNRCRVFGSVGGAMCMCCGIQKECKEMKTK